MAKKHLTYVIEHVGPRNSKGHWRFGIWNGRRCRSTLSVSRRGETKKQFESACRKKLRVATKCDRKRRVLLIRDLRGRFCDEASYNCDSRARG